MTIKTLLATSACLAGLTIASTASAEILVQYNLDGGAPGATIQSAGTATGSNIVLGSFTNNSFTHCSGIAP